MMVKLRKGLSLAVFNLGCYSGFGIHVEKR